MKITKLVHSCVLIEDGDKAVLFNPGVYSWNSGIIEVASFPKLDAVVVTHKHADHLGEDFVRAIVATQPEVQWVAPADAHEQLHGLGVKNVTDQSVGDLQVTTVNHAKVEPFGIQVQNLIVHWNGKVTDPGDTHDFHETHSLLMLPIQAPWGTTIRAFELGLELQPKFILPIHDWMWVEDWRELVYDGLERVFGPTSTKVLRPVNGQVMEIVL